MHTLTRGHTYMHKPISRSVLVHSSLFVLCTPPPPPPHPREWQLHMTIMRMSVAVMVVNLKHVLLNAA